MSQDTRRSRMRRTPKGKRLMLTSRDIAIFRALSQYRYLRSTYLHAFAGGMSETRFKERLGDLFHEGYLNRPEAQWRFADSRHVPVVYELGRGAMRVLKERGRGDDQRRVLLGPGAHRQFEHSIMVCEVVASIELAAMTDPMLRFIPLTEILAKAPESARTASFPLRLPVGPTADRFVVPDALFGLEYLSGARPSYRFFALEADRGTMPISRTAGIQSSLAGKLGAYGELFACEAYRRHLGVPNLLVLMVTTSERRIAALLDVFRAAKATGAFLFKSVGQTRTPFVSVLNQPWERSQRQQLRLDQL